MHALLLVASLLGPLAQPAPVVLPRLGTVTPATAGATEPAALPAPTPAADAGPFWIWGRPPARDGQRLGFRRRVSLDAPVARALLTVAADNAFELFVDGEAVTHGSEWSTPVAVDLSRAFAGAGGTSHELAITVRNGGGPAGLLVELELQSLGRPDRRVVSDTSWRWSEQLDDGWQDPDADDSAWAPAHELAALGGGPWTALTPETWRLAERLRPPTATPVERIVAPDGFRIDLLYSPAPSEGSWVALAFDDRGRAYVSDHYDAGLYRLTLPARRPRDPLAPAAPTWSPEPVQVERIPVDLSGAQGLLWAWGDLYAMVSQNGRHPSGLYRLRDTDDDDQLDSLELLTPLTGGGDHGPHALLRHPDGESLVVVAGNNTVMPPLADSRVPPVWGEDLLLPRITDPSGFMAGARAPGGGVYRIDRDGRRWELLSTGYRNPYDAAFHPSGDLFTFDADMEWDLNTPWYRPTRVCLVASGSDYGWRTGSGKWPSHHADSLAPVLELGPGSPVGLTFGAGTDFPAPWHEALFLADWSYGRVYAAQLQADGAGWRGAAELFLSGTPLPITDLVVHPSDGALYFVTGGRNVQTGVYRLSWAGLPDDRPTGLAARTAPAVPVEGAARGDLTALADGAAPNEARRLRLDLEALHGKQDLEALPAIWAALGHVDRLVRHAARVALEWQPVERWRERALAERDPATSLTALLALVRVSAGDPERGGRQPDPFDPALHPTAARPATPDDDFALGPRVRGALARLDWEQLDLEHRLALLRVHALTSIRLGAPDEPARQALLARFEPHFPSDSPALNGALCEQLVFLRSTRVAAAAVPLLSSAPTQEEQLDLARSLRLLGDGWTPALREAWFDWFPRAEHYAGGASFAGFVRRVRDDALATLDDDTCAAMEARLAAARLTEPPPVPSLLAGRTRVHEWALDELAPRVEPLLTGRDFGRGRALFGAAQCFRCHRVAGEGGAVGPDLSGTGARFSPRELLQSILEPSRTVSDQYQRARIELVDGRTVIGQIINLHDDTVEVSVDMFRPDAIEHLDRRRIVSIGRSQVSPMPEGLLGLLEEDEIADLLAYVLAGGRSDARWYD